MFGTFRKHQQWLWIVIIAAIIVSFVVYFSPNQPALHGFAGGGSEFGNFNGKPLTREELRSFGRQAQLAGRLRFGESADSPQARQMGYDPTAQMYQRLLLDTKMKELGVTVSDDAVARWIRQNLKDPKTGQVDYDAFIERVVKRYGFTEDEFQAYVRHELGMEHLREVLGAAGQLVTPREAEAEFRHENEQAVVSAVFFSSSNLLATVTVEPVALSQFFTNRIAAYRIPERMIVSYVKWDASNHLAAAEAEIAKLPDLTNRLEAMYQQRGADAFRDKDDKPMAKEAALAEIRRQSVESQALALASREARDFANELYAQEPANAANLLTLAAKHGLAPKDTEPFSEFGRIPGLEDVGELAREAAKLTADQPFTKPVMGGASVYLAALRRKVPSEVPAFETVRARVTEDFRRSKAMELARSTGETFATALTNAMAQGKTFAAAADALKAHPVELPPFSLVTTSLPGLDPRVSVSLLKDTAFSLKAGAASRFIPTGDGGFVVFLKERRPVDEASVKAGMNAFMDEQRRQRQDEFFQEWFRQEFQKSGLAALIKKRDEPL